MEDPLRQGPLSWVSQVDLMQINFLQTLKRISGMSTRYQLDSMLNKRWWTKEEKKTNKQTNEKKSIITEPKTPDQEVAKPTTLPPPDTPEIDGMTTPGRASDERAANMPTHGLNGI